jgi:signal transduction histidine kinase
MMPSIPLSPSVRRNVSRIGLEALHNAAKHSGARTVTLGLVRTGRRLVLTVTDDGRGFGDVVGGGEHDGAHGLGLAGMRRRAEAVGASLSVVSHAGEGTQVRLVFDPQADEHTPTHETSHDRAT